MLEVIFRDVPADTPADCIRDVEAFFPALQWTATPFACRLVRLIEQGVLLDSASFRDRFGHVLRTEDLSTSCKAALAVTFSDQWVDTVECGRKGRSVILSLCSGRIVMDTPSSSLIDYADGSPVEIHVEGHVFSTIDALNDYINWGRLIEACTV